MAAVASSSVSGGKNSANCAGPAVSAMPPRFGSRVHQEAVPVRRGRDHDRHAVRPRREAGGPRHLKEAVEGLPNARLNGERADLINCAACPLHSAWRACPFLGGLPNQQKWAALRLERVEAHNRDRHAVPSKMGDNAFQPSVHADAGKQDGHIAALVLSVQLSPYRARQILGVAEI